MMEWNIGSTTCFLPTLPDSSLTFLYNYTPFPGVEVKQQEAMVEAPPQAIEKMMIKRVNHQDNNNNKKKRLTSDQLDSLESSFQKEIKLDPDRKMKLSKELGLHPRQIAVWFQNRRARWKAKQLEHLYDSLKQEFDAISKEKQNLQEEVMKLKGMLRDEQGCSRTQQVSGEEETTVESTSELQALRNVNIADFNSSLPSPLPYWPTHAPNYYYHP